MKNAAVIGAVAIAAGVAAFYLARYLRQRAMTQAAGRNRYGADFNAYQDAGY